MLTKFNSLLFVFLAFYAATFAQPIIKSYYNKLPNSYNFLVNIPANYSESTDSFPVILFLHGRSLSGNDLNRVKKYGVLDAIIRQKVNPNALVLAPQCPKSESWDPDKILSLLNWFKSNYRIDSTRVYVVGMSLGGYGTMDFAGKFPEHVSAAVALCGGGKEMYASNLATIPFWIMHGTADRAVSVQQSKLMENAIRNSGEAILLKTNYYEGLNHGDMADAFYMKQFYDWLFQFDKSDSSELLINNYSIELSDFRRRPIAGRVLPHVAIIDSVNSNSISYDSLANVLHSVDSLDSVVDSISIPPSEPNKQFHVIKKGETLYAISKKYRVTINHLCQLNGINENTILQIGQKLRYQ